MIAQPDSFSQSNSSYSSAAIVRSARPSADIVAFPAQARDAGIGEPDTSSPLNAARGVMIGLPIGLAMWAAFGAMAWLSFR